MAATTRRSSSRAKKEKVEISDEDRQPGVVYIGHVPHGFYEKELKEYFSQFGKVLSVKLSRSKKTGNAKGYAFVKFRYSAVAKTAAETCHNYLFFNKLLKCQYKPLSEVHPRTFVSFNMRPRNKAKREHNSVKSEETLQQTLKKTTRKQEIKIKKLNSLGLDLKLEDIVDVPKPEVKLEQSAKKSTPKKKKTPKKKTPTPKNNLTKTLKTQPRRLMKSKRTIK